MSHSGDNATATSGNLVFDPRFPSVFTDVVVVVTVVVLTGVVIIVAAAVVVVLILSALTGSRGGRAGASAAA
jgi:hypothetical protein